jgi:hypothetical protein
MVSVGCESYNLVGCVEAFTNIIFKIVQCIKIDERIAPAPRATTPRPRHKAYSPKRADLAIKPTRNHCSPIELGLDQYFTPLFVFYCRSDKNFALHASQDFGLDDNKKGIE